MTTTTDSPQLVSIEAHIVSNCPIASGIFRMVLDAPEIAAGVQPGQFVHLRLPALEGHILRRPISVFNADPSAGTVELVYQAVGEGTAHMAALGLGSPLGVLGPAGRGWRPPATCAKALLVGGGVGMAPLFMLAKRLTAAGIDTHFVVGAQSAAQLIYSQDWDGELDMERLHAATDDGSAGYHGFSTDVAAEFLAAGGFDYIATCGPEPMQRKVAALAAGHGVFCEVSLERRMACGVGACLSCVADTKQGKQRTCKDGPVFNAEQIEWKGN